MSIPLNVFAVLVAIALSGIRVANEYQRGVVFRLGRYHGTRGPGLYYLIPLGVETQSLIDIRIRTVPVEAQETITRDSVTIRVNAALWFKVVDPARSVINVTDVFTAVYQLALTTLRNIIGQHDLDEVLQARDRINGLLKLAVVPATGDWGIQIDRLVREADDGQRADDGQPRRAGTAPDADDLGGWGGEQHDDRHHDPIGLRHAGQERDRVRARAQPR